MPLPSCGHRTVCNFVSVLTDSLALPSPADWQLFCTLMPGCKVCLERRSAKMCWMNDGVPSRCWGLLKFRVVSCVWATAEAVVKETGSWEESRNLMHLEGNSHWFFLSFSGRLTLGMWLHLWLQSPCAGGGGGVGVGWGGVGGWVGWVGEWGGVGWVSGVGGWVGWVGEWGGVGWESAYSDVPDCSWLPFVWLLKSSWKQGIGIPWKDFGKGQVKLVEQRTMIYTDTQTMYPKSRNAYCVLLSCIRAFLEVISINPCGLFSFLLSWSWGNMIQDGSSNGCIHTGIQPQFWPQSLYHSIPQGSGFPFWCAHTGETPCLSNEAVDFLLRKRHRTSLLP
jgi:hypothetical protein